MSEIKIIIDENGQRVGVPVVEEVKETPLPETVEDTEDE